MEWSREIKRTIIFNDLCNGICEGKTITNKGEEESPPSKVESVKELAIWNNKENKAYALMSVSVSEEVKHHIVSNIDLMVH